MTDLTELLNLSTLISTDTLKRIGEDLNTAWVNNMLLNDRLCRAMGEIKTIIDGREEDAATETGRQE